MPTVSLTSGPAQFHEYFAVDLSASYTFFLFETRATNHKVEVAGAGRSVYVSTPKEVATLIEEAASQALEEKRK